MSDAPADGLPPERFEFATTDPDEAQDFIARMYRAGRPPRAKSATLASPVSISQVSAGGLSYVDFTMPPDVTLHLTGTSDLSITTLITGGTHAELGKNTERYTTGDAFLGSYPDGDYKVRCLQFRAGIITVPHTALKAVAAPPGRPCPPLRFTSLRPASPASAEQWKHTADYTRDLLTNVRAATSPLITGHTARLLAATALTVFPNNVLADHALHDSRDAHPGTLRRAIDFIDENAATDIGVADIAAAACVTTRAVQLAFRRHLNLTPLQYLRRVRLALTRRELLLADPTTQTVTAIAYRWGFAHPGRFAADYRTTYGEPPSQTLRRR
ncbi:helix-turn-helix domain-containing protein [Streptomyces sp. p1417]|uniref:Helix-turn-helix domain-containing protein n=1 Tax=Streptomyces typhae TaxID=2681492 RepID=A0A6L6XAE4_9ACTN|nr:helix-turn-helix domain-containing protein [Streptomyces typhae]MVO90945.1 helix-turn-helix domain-containing protein [Streptomyces typhae]